ncbi:protein of unknown function [Shinella sp. WSC3-e]|nr:protein of unknown function [Shinella sp. WSC3-e]
MPHLRQTTCEVQELLNVADQETVADRSVSDNIAERPEKACINEWLNVL